MKFTWFNLMPWPYLPDDFRETNRSVWVDIDSKLFDPVKGHEVYNTYLDLLEYAATLGFDGIGRYTTLRNAILCQNQIQNPNPPIHIPGGGSVETYDFCIDNTYSYSYLSFTGYIRANALMDGYWKRVAERNAPDTSPYRAGF